MTSRVPLPLSYVTVYGDIKPGLVNNNLQKTLYATASFVDLQFDMKLFIHISGSD